MRHKRHSARLGRRTAHRISMLRNLATSLFRHKRITTTQKRASEVQRLAEHMIELAKRGDLASKRRVFKHIHDREVAVELFDVIAPLYRGGGETEERKGGYTRLLKLEPRKGDAAPMALLELT